MQPQTDWGYHKAGHIGDYWLLMCLNENNIKPLVLGKRKYTRCIFWTAIRRWGRLELARFSSGRDWFSALQFTPTLLQIWSPENNPPAFLPRHGDSSSPLPLVYTSLAEQMHASFVATAPEFCIIIPISPFSAHYHTSHTILSWEQILRGHFTDEETLCLKFAQCHAVESKFSYLLLPNQATPSKIPRETFTKMPRSGFQPHHLWFRTFGVAPIGLIWKTLQVLTRGASG